MYAYSYVICFMLHFEFIFLLHFILLTLNIFTKNLTPYHIYSCEIPFCTAYFYYFYIRLYHFATFGNSFLLLTFDCDNFSMLSLPFNLTNLVIHTVSTAGGCLKVCSVNGEGCVCRVRCPRYPLNSTG